jgi:hypothetical protein
MMAVEFRERDLLVVERDIMNRAEVRALDLLLISERLNI